MLRPLIGTALAAAAIALPTAGHAAVRITEFMYQGAANGDREFWELTNIGNTAVDLTGWSYNDNNANAPVAFGNAVGMLAANESIIFTELSVAAFRAEWNNLSANVRVFSYGGDSNISGNDTINIYNSTVQNASTLVDSHSTSGSAAISLNRPNLSGAVPSTGIAYTASALGDAYGSVLSVNGDLGNPGAYPFDVAAVPEPATWALMIAGFGLTGASLRRRRRAPGVFA